MLRALLLWVVTGGFGWAGPLTVFCWNIHHGQGTDGRVDLGRIARRIADAKPDLVALQEVDRGCRRSGGIDQAAELGRLTGLGPVFGKAFDFDGGEYGLAVLSRLPVVSQRIHRLPGDGEPRIALEVEVRREGEPLILVTTHLDHRSAERRSLQARALLEALADRKAVILCGDFNDEPGSPTLETFGKGWTRIAKEGPAAAHPAGEPRVDIDHFFLRGLDADGRVSVVEDPMSSDHRPLWMKVR